MNPIAQPETNFNAPDSVLAQTIAADSGWQQDGSGAVYDERGVIVASSLADLGIIGRELGWFTPRGTVASGLVWAKIPDGSATRADQARAAARRLGL
ncbi:hypothetical protein E4U02_07640 [Microbacterium paludicola]|uniref:Uncharacterized protein n=1 Tax=Microbacterium paludicola TaxID=300019 RepID=A0A4Y9FVR5_9MICO|nr:hypothetical protein [Microbacterium paludicola]MBF0816280.1 hypothetical protein [Microbacterium paludicola]TFU33079.1 hypothetical protein E4U02_07640 [Microbacterium paludicola]